MFAIYRRKVVGVLMNAEMIRKFYEAAAAIAAHRAFAAVGIVVFHLEIIPIFFVQKHKTVGTDAKAPIA